MIVAKKFAAPGRRRMQFAVSDAAGDLSAELKDLGVSCVNDTPVVVARDLSERRFIMQQPLTYVTIAHIPVLLSPEVTYGYKVDYQILFKLYAALRLYGDGTGNTVEEKSIYSS